MSPTRRTTRARGMSLLEVILSLAILTGSMAVLGEAARLGLENARHTRDLAQAQLICESKLAEITAGITDPLSITSGYYENSDGTPFVSNVDVRWIYSIETVAVPQQEGLLAVRVHVAQDLPAEQDPVEFALVRWIPDPMLDYSGEPASEVGESQR